MLNNQRVSISNPNCTPKHQGCRWCLFPPNASARGRASVPCITKWICTALGLANLLGSFAQAAGGSFLWVKANIYGGDRQKVKCHWVLAPFSWHWDISCGILPVWPWILTDRQIMGSRIGFINVDIEAWMIIVLSMVVSLKIVSIATFQHWWLLPLNQPLDVVFTLNFLWYTHGQQWVCAWMVIRNDTRAWPNPPRNEMKGLIRATW